MTLKQKLWDGQPKTDWMEDSLKLQGSATLAGARVGLSQQREILWAPIKRIQASYRSPGPISIRSSYVRRAEIRQGRMTPQ